ncbi:MAG: hypothetical protein GHCLOJNM_01212 [bacterium]|nr:hypothetical protein [bacterium]
MKKRDWAIALGIGVATLFAYLPALHGDYVWDDHDYIASNPNLKTVSGLYSIWFEPFTSVNYYPLALTSFWLEYRLWGESLLGHHVLNVLLHATVAVLLWRLLARLAVRGALPAAWVFALHPVHVESVAWMSERKNVLMGVFSLLALHAWQRYLEVGTLRRLLLAAGALALALLSKTLACVLPAYFLVHGWWKGGQKWRRKSLVALGLIPPCLAFAALTIWWERNRTGAVGEPFDFTFLERVLIAGRALWFYAGKLVWPFGLMTIYPRWEIDPAAAWQYLFPLTALVALLAVAWLGCRGHKAPACAAAFYVILLFPALGFFDYSTMRLTLAADHYQYLASMGVIAPLCAVAVVASRSAPAWASRALGVVLLGGLSALTWSHASSYRSMETLFGALLKRHPEAWYAHNNVGGALLLKGRPEEAAMHFAEAARLNPKDFTLHRSLGDAHTRAGRLAEAVEAYRRALALQAEDLDTANGLAIALTGLGRAEEGVAILEQALARAPESAKTHTNLGNALAVLGKREEAARHFGASIRISEHNPEAHYNFGNLLASEGKTAQAIGQYREALRQRPGWKEPAANLAWILATHPDPRFRNGKEAVQLARLACAGPGAPNPVYLDILGAALAESGDFSLAVEVGEEAIRLAESTGQDALTTRIRERLARYREGLPFRGGRN